MHFGSFCFHVFFFLCLFSIRWFYESYMDLQEKVMQVTSSYSASNSVEHCKSGPRTWHRVWRNYWNDKKEFKTNFSGFNSSIGLPAWPSDFHMLQIVKINFLTCYFLKLLCFKVSKEKYFVLSWYLHFCFHFCILAWCKIKKIKTKV